MNVIILRVFSTTLNDKDFLACFPGHNKMTIIKLCISKFLETMVYFIVTFQVLNDTLDADRFV